MADVEIKYNNATIASLNDSGTEVLETNGTFLVDDITVEYTKSGGGSVNKLTLYTKSNYDTLYTDSSCTESLLESCNYDYNEAFNTMVNADIVEIIRQGSNDHYYPMLIRADFIEDSVGVTIMKPNGDKQNIWVS